MTSIHLGHTWMISPNVQIVMLILGDLARCCKTKREHNLNQSNVEFLSNE